MQRVGMQAFYYIPPPSIPLPRKLKEATENRRLGLGSEAPIHSCQHLTLRGRESEPPESVPWLSLSLRAPVFPWDGGTLKFD